MRLLDTNRYYLPSNVPNPPLHIATIEDGTREYLCFYFLGQIYIEEITGGHLEWIEDDQKHEELHQFLQFHGVLDGSKPLLPDEWQKHKPGEEFPPSLKKVFGGNNN